MGQILTREHVENFRSARLARDPQRLDTFIDDNVDWLITGPVELFSFCGQRRGKAEVIDCIVRLQPAVMEALKVELSAMLIDRDRVASFSRMVAIQRSTGRTISYNQAQFMRFRDGKIVEYRGIIDSFNAAEQMIGHPIALSDDPGAIDYGEKIAV